MTLNPLRIETGLRAAAFAVALATGVSMATAGSPGLQVSAYKDVSLAINVATPRIATAVAGGGPSLLPAADGRLPGGLTSLTWAFATGECGQERWGPFDTDAFARLNVGAFVRAGLGYTVSTGGQAGIFACASNEGMDRFVARYASPQLQGFDFDIEGAQTPAQLASLMQRIAYAQVRWPGLQWRFTLATHAASDGSGRSLNATGQAVLAALRDAGVQGAVINLMVMDYGPAEPAVCVLGPDGRCDMGASALQAARNVHQRHGVPLGQIAMTAMLGVNDVRENIMGLEDLQRMARDAAAQGLAGVYVWSLDRDRPCPPGELAVSPTCHGLPGLAPLAMTRALQQGAAAR